MYAPSHQGLGFLCFRFCLFRLFFGRGFAGFSFIRHIAGQHLFGCGLQGGWDWVVLSYFVGCGVSRLARYNVTAEQLAGEEGKVTYFEGTPIPTSMFIVLGLAVLAWQGRLDDALWLGEWQLGPWQLHPLTLVYALSGTLMISRTLRIPKP